MPGLYGPEYSFLAACGRPPGSRQKPQCIPRKCNVSKRQIENKRNKGNYARGFHAASQHFDFYIKRVKPGNPQRNGSHDDPFMHLGNLSGGTVTVSCKISSLNQHIAEQFHPFWLKPQHLASMNSVRGLGRFIKTSGAIKCKWFPWICSSLSDCKCKNVCWWRVDSSLPPNFRNCRETKPLKAPNSMVDICWQQRSRSTQWDKFLK